MSRGALRPILQAGVEVSRRKKKIKALLTIVAIIALVSVVVVSCSKKKKESGKSSSSIAMERYPHIPTMRAEHMFYFAVQSPGSPTSSCAICHVTKSTPLNVDCAGSCHMEIRSETRTAPLAATLPAQTECKPCHAEPTNPAIGGSRKQYSHYVSEVFECKTCHTTDAEHFQIGPGQTKATTNSSSDGCLRCHSRKDTEAHVHSALTLFPQDSCIHCHDPHGSIRRYLTKENSISALCLTCHAGRISLTWQSVHPVMASGKECLNCHKPHSSAHDKLLIIDKDDLCLDCHKSGGIAHSPPSSHAGRTGDICLGCHNPHGCQSASSLLCPSP